MVFLILFWNVAVVIFSLLCCVCVCMQDEGTFELPFDPPVAPEPHKHFIVPSGIRPVLQRTRIEVNFIALRTLMIISFLLLYSLTPVLSHSCSLSSSYSLSHSYSLSPSYSLFSHSLSLFLSLSSSLFAFFFPILFFLLLCFPFLSLASSARCCAGV